MQKIRLRTIRLTIGGDERNQFEVRQGEIVTLGRDPGCTIQINHQSVSPVHCRLEYKHDDFLLVDLDSAEGIFCNGKRQKYAMLHDRTEFQLGDIRITSVEGVIEVSQEELSRITMGEVSPPLKGYKEKKAGREEIPFWLRFLWMGKESARVAPPFALSFVLHLIVLVFVFDIPFLQFPQAWLDNIRLDMKPPPDQVVLQEEPVPPLPELEPPEDPLDNPMENDAPFDFDDRKRLSNPVVDLDRKIDIIGIGAGGSYGSGPSGGMSTGFRKRRTGDFAKFRDELDCFGMDVAFVVDSTSSMARFLTEAKIMMTGLISDLFEAIPNIRVSIVAYRDSSDEYLLKTQELSNDRYQILYFLDTLRADGGGDPDEAIYAGLNRAITHLSWRPKARKVVILLGDSGYKRQDESDIDRLLKDYKHDGGVVNTIYVGDVDPDTYTEQVVLEKFRRMAKHTGGECVLLSEYDRLVRILIRVSFPDRYEANMADLIKSTRMRVEARRGRHLIARKIKEKNWAWLVHELKERIPVHPDIVDALLLPEARTSLTGLVEYLRSDTVPHETKWAVLFILNRTNMLPPDVQYDPSSPSLDQRKQLRRINQYVVRISRKKPPSVPVKNVRDSSASIRDSR